MRKHFFPFSLFVFAFLLRAFVAHHGAPFCYHNDEHWVFAPVFQMIHNHTWDQSWFVLPTLTTLLYRIVGTVFSWIHPLDLYIPQDQWIANTSILPNQFPMLLVGRLMIAFFGSVTVVCVYYTLKKVLDDSFAFLFAFLYAVSITVISYSAFLRPEAMVIFALTGSMLCLVQFQMTKNNIWIWLGGVALGLATGAKYNACFFILASFLFVYLNVPNWHQRFLQSVRILTGSVLGFLISTPYFLWKPSAIINEILHNYHVYKRGQVGDMGTHAENFWYYVDHLSSNAKFQWLFYIALASVLILPLLWKKMESRLKPLLISSGFFCVSYVVFLCQFRYRAERNLIFIHPFIFFFTGTFLFAIYDTKIKWVRTMIVAVLLGTTLNFTYYSVQSLKKYNQPLSQDAALEWLVTQAPQDSRILREFDTPLINPNRYQVIYLYSLAFFPPDALLELNPNYLVLNEFIEGVNRNLPNDYIQKFNNWVWSKKEDFDSNLDVPLSIHVRIVNFQKYKKDFEKTFAMELRN